MSNKAGGNCNFDCYSEGVKVNENGDRPVSGSRPTLRERERDLCSSDPRLSSNPRSASNPRSSIMTVNSHIVLPRICMKYQNMLTEILAGGGVWGGV